MNEKGFIPSQHMTTNELLMVGTLKEKARNVETKKEMDALKIALGLLLEQAHNRYKRSEETI